MPNPYGHIDLRVSAMAEALPFYEALLPELGFTERYHGERWKVFATTDPLPSTAYFGITESPDHVANQNRIAFWVSAPAEVDRLAAVVESSGGRDMTGPKSMPYGPDYYAVYFEDPSGNRFEIYVRLEGQRKEAASRAASKKKSGGVLLSRGLSPRVPSALAGLTSLFGMGRGVPPPL